MMMKLLVVTYVMARYHHLIKISLSLAFVNNYNNTILMRYDEIISLINAFLVSIIVSCPLNEYERISLIYMYYKYLLQKLGMV